MVTNKPLQAEINKRAKVMKRSVQRARERHDDAPVYDEYRHAPDLYYAAVALLIERGGVSPAEMRCDARGAASSTSSKGKSPPFDVYWLWRLKLTPLWELPGGLNSTPFEPQSGLLVAKCIKLLDRLRFEGPDSMAQADRKTYRSLASIRAASDHEWWGNHGDGKTTDPEDGGDGTEGQRLIVFMIEVAAFRIL